MRNLIGILRRLNNVLVLLLLLLNVLILTLLLVNIVILLLGKFFYLVEVVGCCRKFLVPVARVSSIYFLCIIWEVILTMIHVVSNSFDWIIAIFLVIDSSNTTFLLETLCACLTKVIVILSWVLLQILVRAYTSPTWIN